MKVKEHDPAWATSIIHSTSHANGFRDRHMTQVKQMKAQFLGLSMELTFNIKKL